MATTQSPAKKKPKLSLKLTRKESRNAADKPPADSNMDSDDASNYQM